MTKIRLTKIFDFEMAHALFNYDGKCRNIHGHSYKLFVTIIGEPIFDSKNHKNGMVMDFGDLKKIVNERIINKLDHHLMLNENSEYKKFFDNLEQECLFTSFQPTCENLLIYFSEILKKHLPCNVKLFCLKLQETETSFSEWYSIDNEEVTV